MIPASTELIQRYYPDFTDEPYVHLLQVHLLAGSFWPLMERSLDGGDVVVDVGCGAGTTVKALVPKVKTAIGVDLIDLGFRKHRSAHLNLLQASAYDLPFPSDTIDVATSRWMFEHIAHPEAAIAELARVLRPGGRMLIVVPNAHHPGMALSRITPTALKQFALLKLNRIPNEVVMKTYYRANTERKLDRLFRQAGFEKEAFVYSSDPSYWMFSRLLFRWAAATARMSTRLPVRRFRMQMLGLYRRV